jgi:hypothetical protein
MPPNRDTLIETCLVCKVAWDTSMDPPGCVEADHPHSLARVGEWDQVGHGLSAEVSDAP